MYNDGMTTPAKEIPGEKIALYRATAAKRMAREAEELTRRKERAWEDARRAASLLREQFDVSRVVVFGSLTHEGSFTRWSDVDLAAWGIPPEDTFRALGAVMDLRSSVEINLVDVNTCAPSLLELIGQEGVEPGLRGTSSSPTASGRSWTSWKG
jgi:predicted nucleotidyltransferase